MVSACLLIFPTSTAWAAVKNFLRLHSPSWTISVKVVSNVPMWSRDFECASYSWGDGTSLVSGWSFHFARYKCFLVPGKSRSYFTQYWPNELSRWALSNHRYSCLPLFYCKLSSKKSAIDRFLCITVSKHQQEWWMIRKYGYSTMNTDRGSSFVIYLLASLRELQRNCYREGGRRDTKWPQRSR